MKPVLLVEDNADDVFFTRRAFRAAKITNPLTIVGDGDAAIAYLESALQEEAPYPMPGLVLLDLQLPIKSGFEVLQWIRAHAELSSVAVVALVSSRESVDIETTANLGADSFIVKPPTVEKLEEIRKRLGLSFLEPNPICSSA